MFVSEEEVCGTICFILASMPYDLMFLAALTSLFLPPCTCSFESLPLWNMSRFVKHSVVGDTVSCTWPSADRPCWLVQALIKYTL